MLILTAVAPVFATNCYVLVADDGVSCVIVDPGGGVASAVEAVVTRHRLRPGLRVPEEVQQRIREMRAEGKTREVIARELGVSAGAVSKYMRAEPAD